jgi:hypothetical protein
VSGADNDNVKLFIKKHNFFPVKYLQTRQSVNTGKMRQKKHGQFLPMLF